MDESLYVPWKGSPTGMLSEISTIKSIQRKNLKELSELRDSIINLPVLDIQSPVKVGMCKELKRQCVEEEAKCMEKVEKCVNEYNQLLQKENQLLQENNELERTSKKRTLESDALEEELAKKTKIYKEEKYVLNVAKKAYDQTFGTDITVEESSSDLIIATLNFEGTSENFPIRFTIKRTTNESIDFDAGSLHADDQLEQLKVDYRNTGNVLALMCALRKLALNS